MNTNSGLVSESKVLNVHPNSGNQSQRLDTYKLQLRQLLCLWGTPPSTVTEILVELDNHIAEGIRRGRSDEDLLAGLGPVSDLADAYAMALMANPDELSKPDGSRLLGVTVGSSLWHFSLLLMLLLHGVATALLLFGGIAGVVASIVMPIIPPQILEPTLRSGMPQIVLLLCSMVLIGAGVQFVRWLVTNCKLAKALLWRSKKVRALALNDFSAEAQHGRDTQNSIEKSVPCSKLQVVSDNDHRKSPSSLAWIAISITTFLMSGFSEQALANKLIEEEFQARDLVGIQLDMGNGSVAVATTSDAEVRISLDSRLQRFTGDEDQPAILSWFSSDRLEEDTALLEALNLQTTVRNNILFIRPIPRGRERESRVAEEWSITVPENFHVEITGKAVDAYIDGVSGGVKTRLGYGDVEVDVPAGNLDLRLEVGTIEVRSGVKNWRQLSVSSKVGKTEISVDGRKMDYASPPGPGSRATVEGRGTDVISLQVNVGDARLRLE